MVVVEGAEAEKLTPVSEAAEKDPEKEAGSSESDDAAAEDKVNMDSGDTNVSKDVQDTTTVPTDSSSSSSTKAIDWTLASSILVGDFLHNFTDGVFVGTSFLLCDKSVAWTIVASTTYHELAQEIADFALLHHHCGFSKLLAVVYNFVSGFSVVLGAILVLSMDLSEIAQGTTLAIAAGVYIYIAACECIPRVQAVRQTARDTLVFLVSFVLGAVPIGLVLLNHKHCEEGHEDH
jgi:zinc transporter ZupT